MERDNAKVKYSTNHDCTTTLYSYKRFPDKYHSVSWQRKLRSCFLSIAFNSLLRFQMKSRKCLSQSETVSAILFFDLHEKRKLGKGRWVLACCQVSLNSVKLFQRRSRKCIQRPGRSPCFSDQSEKRKAGRGHWDLVSCHVFVEFPSVVSEESSKMSHLTRDRGGHLVFPIGPNTRNW